MPNPLLDGREASPSAGSSTPRLLTDHDRPLGSTPVSHRPPIDRRARRLVLWLAAAWLVPIITHALRVDWLLPIGIVVLTAAMLRGGRTLLDRILLALMLLLGIVPAAGLIFTFWPWGLAPVPIAGLALSVLGLIHVLGARPLQLPRPILSDAMIIVPSAVVTWYLSLPYLATDNTGRLALVMAGEDNSRHFALYDGMRRIGGFIFWEPRAAVPDVHEQMLYYPPGWHISAGLLDGFLRSSTSVGEISSAMNHYIVFAVLGYCLLAMTMLWAARWIAGPLLSFWRLPAVVVFLSGILTYGELPMMFVWGFVSEVLGLALMVGLIAVLVRRPGGMWQQTILMSAATIGIGFAYPLFLPSAFVAIAASLYLNRRHVRARKTALLIVLVAAAVGSLPTLLGLLFARFGSLLSAEGGIFLASRSEFVALFLFVVAALLTPAARRLRAWRSYAMCLAAVICLPIGVKLYAFVTSTGSKYYFEKTLTAVSVTMLVGVGAAALFLPRPRAVNLAPSQQTDTLGYGSHLRTLIVRLTAPASAVLIAVAIGVALGFWREDSTYRPISTAQFASISRHWHQGGDAARLQPMAANIISFSKQYPPKPGVVDVVLAQDGPPSYLQTLYLSMWERRMGSVTPVIIPALYFDADRIGNAAADEGRQIRFIVTTESGYALANEVRSRFPQQVTEIEQYHLLPKPG